MKPIRAQMLRERDEKIARLNLAPILNEPTPPAFQALADQLRVASSPEERARLIRIFTDQQRSQK